MSRRSPEPFLWLLFSAGGVVAALLIPVLLFLFGLAIPLGWLTAPDHEHLLAVLRPSRSPGWSSSESAYCRCSTGRSGSGTPSTTDCSSRVQRLIIVICYGGAVAGSIISAYLLLSA